MATMDEERESSWVVIRRYGVGEYRRLVAEAVVILHEDRRLVGCDRLRRLLAEHACERAIGCSRRSFTPPRELWSGSHSIPSFCEELISAVALRLRLSGRVNWSDDRRRA